jgi:Integrase zinc binding domain
VLKIAATESSLCCQPICRICSCEQARLLSEVHDEITEGAHVGYHRTYNRLVPTYYWPRMSRDIKKIVTSCDICQKAKPKKHAPIGMLQPLPIPEKPFEVVSMDFITELPESNGYDSILVVIDKLTKYAILIPTYSTVDEVGTAQLFFEQVVSKLGLPRQIISDRHSRWTGAFGKIYASN